MLLILPWIASNMALTNMQSRNVSIWRGESTYPKEAPFNSSESYPEYPFDDRAEVKNGAYEAVRESLRLLCLDDRNYGNTNWNPLRGLIKPGDNVLMKPNLICESHSSRPNEWEQVITHPSIIRAVLDYVFIALKGKGKGK